MESIATILMTAFIVIFIVSLFVWTKMKTTNRGMLKTLSKKTKRSGLNEAQQIILEGYRCRWNPKEDPKFSKLFHPVYS